MTPVDLGKNYAFGGDKFQTLGQLVSQLVAPVFVGSTIIVFLYFVYGALKYLLSGGNKEEIAKGRAMITNGLIGFFLLIAVFILYQYLPQVFFNN